MSTALCSRSFSKMTSGVARDTQSSFCLPLPARNCLAGSGLKEPTHLVSLRTRPAYFAGRCGRETDTCLAGWAVGLRDLFTTRSHVCLTLLVRFALLARGLIAPAEANDARNGEVVARCDLLCGDRGERVEDGLGEPRLDAGQVLDLCHNLGLS